MATPSFLILTEGEKDVKDIVMLIEAYFSEFIEVGSLKLDFNESRDIVKIEFNDNIASVYIKNAVSQNLKKFIEDVNTQSVEKLYSIDKNLTAIFSLYDLDHGSTTIEQHLSYMDLFNKHENFYPLLCYPGYESFYIQGFHKTLLSELNTLINEKRLDNIKNLIDSIKINNFSIELETPTNISTTIKKLSKQIKKSKLFEEINTEELCNNNFNYLVDCYKKDDYYYYLENQKEIYEEAFVPDDKIILTSFVVCMFKMIFDWVNDEDKE